MLFTVFKILLTMYLGNIIGKMPLAIDSMFIAINKKLFMHGNKK